MKYHVILWLSGVMVLGGGCCMLLEEPKPTQIDGIVTEHKLQVNRAEELDLLCGKAWVPVYIKGQEGIDGKNAIELPPDIQSYIEFQRDGMVHGFSGVNHFSGSFAVTAPNLLRFGALAMTLMAGPHLDYEMLFMAQVNEVANFEVKDGMLELKKRNMLMLRCKPVDPAAVRAKTKSEPAGKIEATAAGKAVKPDAVVNPALPTVEKLPMEKNASAAK